MFRNSIVNEFPKLNEMITELSIKIKTTKDKRHEKLHEGSTEFEYLKSIVFWNDFHSMMNKEAPEILKGMTQENINSMVENIKE